MRASERCDILYTLVDVASFNMGQKRIKVKKGIQTLIIATFTAILATIIISCSVIYDNVSKLGDNVTFLVEHNLFILKNTQKLQNLLTEVETWESEESNVQADQFHDHYKSTLSQLDSLLSIRTKIAGDLPDHSDLLVHIKAQFDQLNNIVNSDVGAVSDSAGMGISMMFEQSIKRAILKGARLEIEKFVEVEQKLQNKHKDQAQKLDRGALQSIFISTAVIALVLIAGALLLIQTIVPGLNILMDSARKVAKGELEVRIAAEGKHEIGELSHAFNQMVNNLQTAKTQNDQTSWLEAGLLRAYDAMRNATSLKELSSQVLQEISHYLKASEGTFHSIDENRKVGVIVSVNQNAIEYHASEEKDVDNSINEAVKSKQILTYNELLPHFSESVSEHGAINSVIVPFVWDDQVEGVITLVMPSTITALELRYLERVSSSIAIGLKITRSKESLEEAFNVLQDKEADLSNTMKAINRSNATIEFDAKGKILDANDNFLALLGYQIEEIIGKHHSIFIPKTVYTTESSTEFWALLAKGEYQKGEFLLETRQGKSVWVYATYNPIIDANGNLIKVLEVATDITQRKKDRLTLDTQIATLNNAAIVAETDEKGNITFVNDLFNRISKYEKHELIGQNHRMLKSGKQAKSLFDDMWKTLSSGHVWTGEILNINKNKEEYWVKTTITPFVNIEGKIYKYVAVGFDITGQKELQQKLQENAEELSQQQQKLVQKAKELEDASTYKSEFLANMSHELRTPLNSILLLSKLLADNAEGSLTQDQAEYADVIYQSGKGLLELISDILDLSKIEAGKMNLSFEQVDLETLSHDLNSLFTHVASEKAIDLKIEIDPKVPTAIETDKVRLEQVLKNLLSNAIKFTQTGEVVLRIYQPKKGTKFSTIRSAVDQTLAFEVKDTGIGIPTDKMAMIFIAFQQADGSTQRKYGGTGLGLSISRNIATLLGGEISVASTQGEGSAFTLFMPVTHHKSAFDLPSSEQSTDKSEFIALCADNVKLDTPNEIPDDRDSIIPGDKVILIIEDDTTFAEILMGIIRSKGYKVIVSVSGLTAFSYTVLYQPVGILLDVQLPGLSGWAVLAHLKKTSHTRHIPVQMMSSLEVERQEFLKRGALDFFNKPITFEQLENALNRFEKLTSGYPKKILIIGNEEAYHVAIRQLINDVHIRCLSAYDFDSAMIALNNNHIDCILLNLALVDSTGSDVLTEIRRIKKLTKRPLIVHTSENLDEKVKAEIQKEALLSMSTTSDQLNSLCNDAISLLQGGKTNLVTEDLSHFSSSAAPTILENNIALIVEDDLVTLMILKKILEKQNMQVLLARDGKEALKSLEKCPEISIILMDILMPKMDGYETMHFIRKEEKWANLPIIAVTSLTNVDDRAKCIQAGASDYITKPVNQEQIVSVLTIWLQATM